MICVSLLFHCLFIYLCLVILLTGANQTSWPKVKCSSSVCELCVRVMIMYDFVNMGQPDKFAEINMFELCVWALCASSVCKFCVRVLCASSVCELCVWVVYVSSACEFYVWALCGLSVWARAHINPSQRKFAFQKELAARPPHQGPQKQNDMDLCYKAAGDNGGRSIPKVCDRRGRQSAIKASNPARTPSASAVWGNKQYKSGRQTNNNKTKQNKEQKQTKQETPPTKTKKKKKKKKKKTNTKQTKITTKELNTNK